MTNLRTVVIGKVAPNTAHRFLTLKYLNVPLITLLRGPNRYQLPVQNNVVEDFEWPATKNRTSISEGLERRNPAAKLRPEGCPCDFRMAGWRLRSRVARRLPR